MDAALIALNRFGLGARPGEREAVSAPRDWLRTQLRPTVALLPATGLPTVDEAAVMLRNALRAAREPNGENGEPDMQREGRRATAEAIMAERDAALGARVTSDTPYVERLVAFWSNHLCVSMTAKRVVAPFAGLYEREVIRPHVFGRYRDMVLASARHPAMLLYLDNARSFGPDSRGAQLVSRFSGSERGLNENYARELLELHTLGVDGGYGQDDVEQLALVLTGWTMANERIGRLAQMGGQRGRRGRGGRDQAPSSMAAGGGFVFVPQLHQPGDKRVLGRTYPEGEEAGREVIADLCAHPSTAHFVAAKLVRHFVADEPPARAVNEIAAVFQDTDGDLRRVSEALIDLPEAWESDRPTKFRTPQDWLVAVGRAIGVDRFPPRLAQVLTQLRQPLWGPAAPKGYDDVMGPWADPDSLMNRAELARTVADAVARAGFDPERLLSVVDVPADGALAGLLADRSIRGAERVALAIGGPDFQWR